MLSRLPAHAACKFDYHFVDEYCLPLNALPADPILPLHAARFCNKHWTFYHDGVEGCSKDWLCSQLAVFLQDLDLSVQSNR